MTASAYPPRGAAVLPRGAVPLDDALRDSAPLSRLRERLRQSEARFAAVRAVVPAALAEQVRPGPIDDQGWTLLAAHTAAAAKLRQLLPRIEQQLQAQGWPPLPLRVRVLRG